MTFDYYHVCGSCNSQCTAMEREVSLALLLFCYFKDLLFYMCECYACMYVCARDVWCLQRSEEYVASLGLELGTL